MADEFKRFSKEVIIGALEEHWGNACLSFFPLSKHQLVELCKLVGPRTEYHRSNELLLKLDARRKEARAAVDAGRAKKLGRKAMLDLNYACDLAEYAHDAVWKRNLELFNRYMAAMDAYRSRIGEEPEEVEVGL
jgi:hypothetical protein